MSEQYQKLGEGPAVASAERHWRELVERRARQMDAAYAKAARTSNDYWQRRMGRSSLLRHRATAEDPLLRAVLNEANSRSTVLDVGAGPGRYTRALASHVGSITAVEPDETMADLFERATAEGGLSNVRLLRSTWQDAVVAPAEIVLCAHVLYPVAEAADFIRKLDRQSERVCFLALRGTTPEPAPLGDLWREYHGGERCLQPGYLDAYNLLHELGIDANVQIVPSTRSIFSFDDLDQAVDAVREHLILPPTAEVDGRLRRELERSLVADGERLTLPQPPAPAAIIWWPKGQAT